MPRVTRRSLASKKEEGAPQPAPSSGGQGKRGSRKAEPEEEPLPIGEPSSTKTARSTAKGKGATPKEEPPKGRTSSRGRGKKDEEPEPEIVEKESPTPKRGRGGKGKKNEPEEKIEEKTPTPKRGARGGRGKKEEVKEEEPEEDDEELPPPPKRAARGGRAKKQEEPEEEEEESPSPRKAVRGGRGKKEEVKEEEEAPPSKRTPRGGRGKKEESDDTEKAATKGRGRSARGSKSSVQSQSGTQSEEVNEEEIEESTEEVVKAEVAPSKGRQSRTPTKPQVTVLPPSSGGRRSGGRGKKEEVSPASTTLTPSRKETAVVAEEEVEKGTQIDEVEAGASNVPEVTKEEMVKKDGEKSKEATTEDMEIVSKEKDGEEQMEVESIKENAEVESVAPPEMEVMESEKNVNKKRKLDDEEEDESASKKARIIESSSEETKVDTSKQEDITTDFVVVNKEDVPAANSKEVEAALPPPLEEKPDEIPVEQEAPTTDTVIPPPPKPADTAAPTKSVPTIVPLTEAELAKQYNPTVRDRDDNLSMMVEVGSEAASDVGSVSMSRNLDISEATSMDVTSNMDQPCEDDSVASSEASAGESVSSLSKLTESTVVPPASSKIPLPPQSTAAAQESIEVETASSKIVSSIPLPVQSSVQEQSTVTPLQSSSVSTPTVPSVPVSTPPAAPAHIPPMVPTSAPEVQLNSIPLPPDYNMSNSTSEPSGISSQQPLHPSTIPPVAQNATTQNGNIQSNEQVSKSLPILTSTPAKKPVLLDSNYIPSSPSITQRKFKSNPNFPIELMDPAFCFSVVSYNILADCHLKRYNYSYTESQFLEQSYRHSLFLKELDFLDGDIVCMQEVDTKYYHDVMLPAMTSRGYQGMFKKRTQDWYDEGEATFVKTSKFEVLSYEGISLKDLAYDEIEAAGLTGDVSRAAKKYLDRADVVLVCKLLSKKTGKHLTVGNIHVAFDPKAPDVQCIQVASAVKELVSKAGSDLNPYIICGDFNSETTSAAYQLAKDGYLSDEHIRTLQSIQSMDNTEGASRSIIHYLWKAFQHTSSNMKSAYETSVGKEPAITSLNGLVKACLDYIFFSSSTLYTVGALEVLDPQIIEATGGLPSKDIPSDHVSVKTVFRLK